MADTEFRWDRLDILSAPTAQESVNRTDHGRITDTDPTVQAAVTGAMT